MNAAQTAAPETLLVNDTFCADDARAIFNKVLATVKGDPDRVARIEFCREYFCNPEFRQATRDEVARINGV